MFKIFNENLKGIFILINIKMKTGIKNHNFSNELYHSVILSLDCLLKRSGFKDSVLFKNHNQSYIMNRELFASGVCFNLFSEYGVNKKLEILIRELFDKGRIDYEKYKDNIFFQEIIRLTEFTIPLIRDFDPIKENEFTYKYAIENICKVDKISTERLERLLPLFEDLSGIIVFCYEEYNDNEENVFCNCGFCNEFRKYHYPREENINKIIMDVLINLRTYKNIKDTYDYN
jgi:hypothetical protein